MPGGGERGAEEEEEEKKEPNEEEEEQRRVEAVFKAPCLGTWMNGDDKKKQNRKE